MALDVGFCPQRPSAGLTSYGDCRHCQRQVDRYLDLTDAQRLEADRLTLDFDGYADTDLDTARPAAA